MSKWNIASKWISRELAIAGGTIYGLLDAGQSALSAGDTAAAQAAFIAAGVTAVGYALGMGVQKGAAALSLPGDWIQKLIDGLQLAQQRELPPGEVASSEE